MRNIYGYIQNCDDNFIETGTTERGAKMVATKRELNTNFWNEVTVGYRSSINNMFIPTAKNVNGIWIKL
ncbi:hypothetical protein MYOV085v1_p0018 [Vibrio phage 355E48.1]|nr:hypothetical protein MYOV085v1_p0018 [Vibrio phage 355E48.1]